jgi:hypothetical protein
VFRKLLDSSAVAPPSTTTTTTTTTTTKVKFGNFIVLYYQAV